MKPDFFDEANTVMLTATPNDAGVRLDRFAAEGGEFSRSALAKLIENGALTVNGKSVSKNYRMSAGDVVEITLPEPEPCEAIPQDIPLDIVYEDDHILIVNKGKGMVVHPAPGHYTGTLVNALMHHCKDNLSGINGELRPGIVHRIDMDTTGLLVICKNDKAHNFIAEQLKEHSITRKYQAIVYNAFKDEEGTIEGNIGRHPNDRKKMTITQNGKEAITHYKVLKNLGKYTLVECQLETGRTHQIRVHMKYIGYPLAGDPQYGPRKTIGTEHGQFLHAAILGFDHPQTGEYLEFSTPLPSYFEEALESLEILG